LLSALSFVSEKAALLNAGWAARGRRFIGGKKPVVPKGRPRFFASAEKSDAAGVLTGRGRLGLKGQAKSSAFWPARPCGGFLRVGQFGLIGREKKQT